MNVILENIKNIKNNQSIYVLENLRKNEIIDMVENLSRKQGTKIKNNKNMPLSAIKS